MSSQPIDITNSQGEKIVCELSTPVGIQKAPLVILAHGLGGNRHESENDKLFDEIATQLLSQNMSVCQFDFSGMGDSAGTFQTTTVSKVTAELDAVIAAVKDRADVIPGRVAVLGFSYGVLAALARGPQDIKTFALLSSPTNALTIAENMFRAQGTLNKTGISTLTWEKEYHIEPGFWTDLAQYDFKKLMTETFIPTIFLQGADDTTTPPQEAQELYDVASEPKEIHIIPGAGHGFTGAAPRTQLIDALLSWFNKHL